METNEFAGPAEGGCPAGFPDNHQGAECDPHALVDGAASMAFEDSEGEIRELASLRQKVKELEESLRTEDDKHKRLLADFQNFRNRASKDVQMGVEQAKRQIMLEVLQVLDSFNRCMGSTYSSIEALRAGVELIQKQFYDALRRSGVSEIEIHPGDMFDAHIAEALTTIENANFHEGSVVDVCEKGFNLDGRLLRPARVVVAHGNNLA